MSKAFLFDVSIVLNTQAGSVFLTRALLSIEEAAHAAQEAGLTLELVFIMNRSPPAHIALTRRYTSAQYGAIRVIEVSHDSLGLARQEGLEAARGEYIMFADDDDLISANSIVASHSLAVQLGPRTIVIPNYLVSFGYVNHIAEYRDLDEVTPLAMIKYHPFISRIFMHSSARADLHYIDVVPGTGYAFEDWHFNANAIARGYTFACAAGTILFYRQRTAGLLAQFYAGTARQIPPSDLFVPETFLRVCGAAAANFGGRFRAVDYENVRRIFLDDPACRIAAHAANQIDPSVDWRQIQQGSAWVNYAGDLRAGAAYYRACALVRGHSFDHIILCDDASQSRRVRDVVSAVAIVRPGAKTLVLTITLTQHVAPARDGSVLIDIGAIGSGLPDEDVDLITLRLIENVGPRAVLHLFGGAYVRRFFKAYRTVLHAPAFYYRTADPVRLEGQLAFIDGTEIEFLSEVLPALTRVVSDCRYGADRDRARIGFLEDCWDFFYPSPSRSIDARDTLVEVHPPPSRLLWIQDPASDGMPMAHQLAPALQACDMQIDTVCPQSAEASKPFDLLTYWAVLHTALTEHMPPILLDALAAGIPVVAFASGGIDEIVIDDRTGWLIRPDTSDDVVAEVAAAVRRCRLKADVEVGSSVDQGCYAEDLLRRNDAAAFLGRTLDPAATARRASLEDRTP